jgi:hypothetical protein
LKSINKFRDEPVVLVSRRRAFNFPLHYTYLAGYLIDRGGVFISEYSQVLIYAFLKGRLGIIANLTSRRFFMEYYEHLGFLSARKAEDRRSLII